MTRRTLLACILTVVTLATVQTTARAADADAADEVAVILGAPGEDTFAAGFAEAVKHWEETAARAGATITIIGRDESGGIDDRTRLEEWLRARASAAGSTAWVVFIGHGTYDGRDARLNLRGPDVTAKELSAWLANWERPLVFVHGGSAAGPFVPALSGPNRIVIAATRSGHETNYARFGERFAAAIGSAQADIDQDGQTSVLEAFVTAAQQVQSFYTEAGRLATEHALIDDNGDREGTPAEWFRGTRVIRRASGDRAPDGDAARLAALILPPDEQALTVEQRRERDRWEAELTALRARKPEMDEDAFYRELERILRRLGAIYRGDS